MEKIVVGVIAVVVFLGCVALVVGLEAAIMYAFWNSVAVPTFHWPILNFWQCALVCIVLSMIGGFFHKTTSSK